MTAYEYTCPLCGAKVTMQVFGLDDGEHEAQWACAGVTQHRFGLPHLEKFWTFDGEFADDELRLQTWHESKAELDHPLELLTIRAAA